MWRLRHYILHALNTQNECEDTTIRHFHRAEHRNGFFSHPSKIFFAFCAREEKGEESHRALKRHVGTFERCKQTDSIDASFERRLHGADGKGKGEDDDDDDEEESKQQMQLVLSKLKVPDLKSELEKRKLKKTGKKQELVDRLVVALERERKSLATTKKMMLAKRKK